MLRRLKSSVNLKLPGKELVLVTQGFSKDEQDCYAHLLGLMKTALSAPSTDPHHCFSILMKLRQLCLSYSLVQPAADFKDPGRLNSFMRSCNASESAPPDVKRIFDLESGSLLDSDDGNDGAGSSTEDASDFGCGATLSTKLSMICGALSKIELGSNVLW